MGLFDFFKKKPVERPPLATGSANNCSPALKMAEATQYFQMLLDSVEIISKTIYCKTFFYRYGFAVENARKVLQLSKGLSNENAAQDMLDILVREKTNIVNDFLFRCYDAGKIGYVEKDILPYMAEVPEKCKQLLKAMLESEDLENIAAEPNTCDQLFALILSATIATELSKLWYK